MVIVGIAVAFWIYRMMAKNPAIRQAYGQARFVAECQMHLQNPNSPDDIADALERYAKRNGKYPASLEELHPNFLANKAILHCPADPHPNNTVSYEYYPPAIHAPGTTIVVQCRRHRVFEDQPPLVLSLYKNGQVAKQGYTPRSGPAEPATGED